MTSTYVDKYDPIRLTSEQVKNMDKDSVTICKGCGHDMIKGEKFHSCCSSQCFRDAYC